MPSQSLRSTTTTSRAFRRWRAGLRQDIFRKQPPLRKALDVQINLVTGTSVPAEIYFVPHGTPANRVAALTEAVKLAIQANRQALIAYGAVPGDVSTCSRNPTRASEVIAEKPLVAKYINYGV